MNGAQFDTKKRQDGSPNPLYCRAHAHLLAALMLSLPSVSYAQTIRGAGARPCQDWSLARRSGGRAFEAEQWTLGYMSAINAAGRGGPGGLFGGGAEKAAFAAIDTYCTSHPDDMLWNAVKAALSTSHGA